MDRKSVINGSARENSTKWTYTNKNMPVLLTQQRMEKKWEHDMIAMQKCQLRPVSDVISKATENDSSDILKLTLSHPENVKSYSLAFVSEGRKM